MRSEETRDSQRQTGLAQRSVLRTRAEAGPRRDAHPPPSGPVLPDDGQLGEGHGRQAEAVGEGDELHRPRALGRVALQALRHVLLF